MRRGIAILAAMLAPLVAAAQSAPDIILVRGKVFTADASQRFAEAVAISGERIVAVGKTVEIEALAGEKTIRYDLGGRLVVPGFNDAHVHFGAMPPAFSLATGRDATVGEVAAAIAGAIDETPADLWIIGTIGPKVLDDPVATATALDKVAGGRKVILEEFTGHGSIWSSSALAAVRAPQRDPMGGWYGRDASGRMDGKVYEYAGFNLRGKLTDLASDEEQAEALHSLTDEALHYGITTLQIMPWLPMARFEKLVRHTNPPIRIRMIRKPPTSESGRDTRELRGFSKTSRERPLAVVSGIKWILDGTPVERGAALRTPYPGSDEKGKINFTNEEIAAMLKESADANEPLLLHVSGDRTAATVLDLMKASGRTDWPARRVRFEHGDGLQSDLIPAARELGVVVVLNPTHFFARPAFPKGDYMLCRSLLRSGIPVAIGSDGPLNPFVNLQNASAHPTIAAESITREEALEAYTRGSAFAETSENEKGTIAPGMLADLAVLSQDIFRIPANALPDTFSVMTIVGGRVAYRSGELRPSQRSGRH